MSGDGKQAARLLSEGAYTCVLYRDGLYRHGTVYTSHERGVKPLLDWLEAGVRVRGFSAADKVVGRAAAFLYVLLGVREVYAPVMSEGAVAVLTQNGIAVRYDRMVQEIINRAGTDCCPMEKAVREIAAPEEALLRIRQTYAVLCASS